MLFEDNATLKDANCGAFGESCQGGEKRTGVLCSNFFYSEADMLIGVGRTPTNHIKHARKCMMVGILVLCQNVPQARMLAYGLIPIIYGNQC